MFYFLQRMFFLVFSISFSFVCGMDSFQETQPSNAVSLSVCDGKGEWPVVFC